MTAAMIATLILRIALAAVFAVMGVLHFLPAGRRGMRAMIPPRLRRTGILSPAALVAFTGVCELAGAAGLLYPPTRVAAGICLVVFLLAVFPANAYAAAHRDRFGAVAVPLIPRALGQAVLILLVLLAAFLP